MVCFNILAATTNTRCARFICCLIPEGRDINECLEWIVSTSQFRSPGGSSGGDSNRQDSAGDQGLGTDEGPAT